jgi:hypothetical protein
MGLMWDLIAVIVIFQWENCDFMGFIWLKLLRPSRRERFKNEWYLTTTIVIIWD